MELDNTEAIVYSELAGRLRIGIVGCLAKGTSDNNGQVVKTRTLFEALSDCFSQQIRVVDTKNYRAKPLSTFWSLLRTCRDCDVVIAMLADGGRRWLFPLLARLKDKTNIVLIHDSIGGKYADELKAHPKRINTALAFDEHWMESNAIVDEMQQIGLGNATFIPNFKNIKPIDSAMMPKEFAEPYPFCTFSRVAKEKGILSAVDAICQINRESGRTRALLHIYGEVEDAISDTLFDSVEKYPFIEYRGVVDPSKSVDYITNYFGFLFPTKYDGEGMPGSVIDSLAAGVPVISSKWRYYDDILEDEVTGYSYEYGRDELLAQTILKSINDPESFIRMKSSCLERSYNYLSPYVANYIAGRILAKYYQTLQSA